MEASSGTLLAAALETAGYQAQEMVLRDLHGMYTGIAAVLFTGALILAITTIALQGQYKVALWFLIGPSLFFFVVGSQVTTDGSHWAMGAFKGQDEDVKEKIGPPTASTQAKVSWLFAAYNSLISSLVQEGAKVILNSDVKRQLIFMSRQRIMDEIIRPDIGNGKLLELVKHGVGECRTEYEAARQIAAANRNTEVDDTALDYMRTTHGFKDFKKTDKKVNFSPTIREYLRIIFASLKRADFRPEMTKRWCGLADGGIKTIFDGTQTIDTYLQEAHTCEEVWCWMGLGFAMEADAIQELAEEKYIDSKYAKTGYPIDPKTGKPSIYKEVWDNIAVKMSPPDLSKNKLDIDGEEDPNINPIEPDASIIPVIISGILFRKVFNQDPRSNLATQFARHSGVKFAPVNFRSDLPPEDSDRFGQAMVNHEVAQALRYETFHFAMSLPYIQGFLLYGLSILFPFFAVLLVIPGKAQSFMAWLTLWAWVKCWDVGWALVYVADDIIWNLMPHTSVFNETNDPNHTPIQVLEAAFQADPAYSLSNYYMLLGMMINSVPILSGQAILGSKAAVGGFLINGLKSVSEKIGGTAADYAATAQTHRLRYLADNYRFNWVKNQMDNDNMFNKTISDLNAQAKAELAKGASMANTGLAIAGVVGLGGLVVAGAAAAPALLGGAVVKTVVGGGLTTSALGQAIGFGEHRLGIARQRQANEAIAMMITTRGQALYESTNYLNPVINLYALQQATMNRGQFYDAVTSQLQVHTDPIYAKTLLDGSIEGADEARKGYFIRAVADAAFTRGK